MAEQSDEGSEPDLQELLRRMLSGGERPDAAELAKAMGVPGGAAGLESLMSQLRQAMQHADGGIDWNIATEQAVAAAGAATLSATDRQTAAVDQAFTVANLWLDESSRFGALPDAPRALTRTQWIRATMPFWSQLAEPVAQRIAASLTTVFTEQLPEEVAGSLPDAGRMLKSVCGTIFAAQLGAVVGDLATEVVSGGDVGVPLLPDGQAALLPQNLAAFAAGLDLDEQQVTLYLAVRELAHARLFRNARWLRLNLTSAIADFSRDLSVDVERIQSFAEGFDPTDMDRLRDAFSTGELIPPKTDAQLAALARLETLLALVEGWVDVVTADAVTRLPRAGAIAETVRRRRATGGPAEQAFATLVGLELRPRRLREAAAMWRRVTEAAGIEARDALWTHPDLLPTGADIDDPDRLVARLTGGGEPQDDVDREIADLLRGDDDPPV
ncbi:zinc-dependent metalloprotease [Amnibacterium sp. CER49]|uniref:zinc-dependent metalloprotease n=1 Tax=Amnibacterium sp. CER49 TaxID=3039161 RepID=UPI00244A13A0|nr:zinc-dependent metalloprotease [Amnibacterium sp. CER49]MDH2445308.1 zinc-dependent metalloprotease [Amnibacterium sp. CER49]